MSKRLSIKKVYRNMLAVIILSTVLAVLLGNYLRRELLDQILASGNETISGQLQRLENVCSNANMSLMNLLSNDSDVQTLLEETEITVLNMADNSLQTTFSNMRRDSLNICVYFLYDSRTDRMVMPIEESGDFVIEEQLRRLLRSYLRTESGSGVQKLWEVFETGNDETNFIYKIYRREDIYVGACIRMDTLSREFDANAYSNVNKYMAIVADGSLVYGAADYERIMGTSLVSVNEQRPYETWENYVVSWRGFRKGNFSFVFLLNEMDYFQNVQTLLILVVVLVVFILMTGILLLVYVERRLMRPLYRFVETLSLRTIGEEQEGKWMEQMPYFEETAKVEEMFRLAENQIRNLKIEIYEKEIEKNKIEMNYLQQQIKPHFYLNCMNMIYNMAVCGQTGEIQKFSVEISDYLRGIFRQSDRPVTLEAEIDHVRKYLEINMLRYDGELDYRISMEEGIGECLILPLLIHTLVENSIKYALYGERMLMIEINAREKETDGERYVSVCVYDNGGGYPVEVLEHLKNLGQDDPVEPENGKHIGLMNIVKRLQAYYGEQAGITFSNREQGGAAAELLIPQRKRE